MLYLNIMDKPGSRWLWPSWLKLLLQVSPSRPRPLTLALALSSFSPPSRQSCYKTAINSSPCWSTRVLRLRMSGCTNKRKALRRRAFVVRIKLSNTPNSRLAFYHLNQPAFGDLPIAHIPFPFLRCNSTIRSYISIHEADTHIYMQFCQIIKIFFFFFFFYEKQQLILIFSRQTPNYANSHFDLYKFYARDSESAWENLRATCFSVIINLAQHSER